MYVDWKPMFQGQLAQVMAQWCAFLEMALKTPVTARQEAEERRLEGWRALGLLKVLSQLVLALLCCSLVDNLVRRRSVSWS